MKNEIRTIGNTAYMALYDRKGNVNNITVFDKAFIDIVKQFRWCAYKHRNTYYVSTTLNDFDQLEYGKIKLKIYQLFLKYEKPLMIDHKDHDGLNNKLSNLRIVSNRANCENKVNKNKHGYVGLSFHKRDKVWVSAIQVNGKNKHIGNFQTKEEAYEAREHYKLINSL